MTCAPSEDSDQPGHPPSLIRVFSVCMKKPLLPTECLAKTDQTGQMPWLIWVFAGRTCHYVGFVMMRLNFTIDIQFCYISDIPMPRCTTATSTGSRLPTHTTTTYHGASSSTRSWRTITGTILISTYVPEVKGILGSWM